MFFYYNQPGNEPLINDLKLFPTSKILWDNGFNFLTKAPDLLCEVLGEINP